MSAQKDMDAILREDVSDSRDLVARLEYLGVDDWEAAGAYTDVDPADREEAERLFKALRAVADYAEDNVADGVTLIRSRHWVDYVRQYAKDIGTVNAEASWPNDCIDWDRAADELAMDYTVIEIDGSEYYIR